MRRRFGAPQDRIGLQQANSQVAPLRPELLDQRSDLRDEGVDLFGRKQFHDVSTLRVRRVALERLVFVTGLSGAGKSQAMKTLEDLGFYCVDNLPPKLVSQTLSLLKD